MKQVIFNIIILYLILYILYLIINLIFNSNNDHLGNSFIITPKCLSMTVWVSAELTVQVVQYWSWCGKSIHYEAIETYWLSETHTHTLIYTDLLQAAGTPAGDAAERPYETDDFPVSVVLDLHVEAAQRAAAVPGAAVVLLFGLVDLLT